MSISIISAVAENNAIGLKNDLPWNLPRDLKHFSKITKGHTVVMGLNTYHHLIMRLGKNLPDRKSVVVTPDDFTAEGVEVIHEFDPWAEKAKKDSEEFFIIGGAMMYRTALPVADKLYITKVHAKPEGDTFFPEIDEKIWKLTSSEFVAKDEKNEHDVTFTIYERH
ncbi:MAG: dihydrofolate reductase [Candidatus Taylorbacteria bacterium]|nr:dihydrofolate reductase [Candidatus Taylorbacteria bacterium]